MRLEKVTGGAFSCTCVQCRRPMLAGDHRDCETVYADLDGAAFVDYYCALCAGDARVAHRGDVVQLPSGRIVGAKRIGERFVPHPYDCSCDRCTSWGANVLRAGAL